MKRTKKLLAGILASSLAVMSLPFYGLSAVADDAIIDGNETIHTWVDLVTVLTPSENRYNLDRLYHNPETKTAFNYSFEALPHALHFLLTSSDTFDDGMEYNVAADGSLKFPDAEITIDQDSVRLFPTEHYEDSYLTNANRMGVTNHGPIVYVDANGEEHSFSGFPDLENYIIQNYDVTVVDYDKYVEDGSIVPIDAVTTPVNNTTATSYFTGDVTGDGAVDLMDAISLNKIFAGLITPTDVQTSAADINQDGSVADDDLTILMQFLIGLRSDLTDAD